MLVFSLFYGTLICFVVLIASHRVYVLDMHASLCYCAFLVACSDDHLLCYMIIVVILKWLFWCLIKLLTCFTSRLLDRNLLVTLYLSFFSLDLPWGSNVFCASVSGYRYICSKCYTTSRFRCEWVLPLFPNSRLSLESVIRCFVTE